MKSCHYFGLQGSNFWPLNSAAPGLLKYLFLEEKKQKKQENVNQTVWVWGGLEGFKKLGSF